MLLRAIISELLSSCIRRLHVFPFGATSIIVLERPSKSLLLYKTIRLQFAKQKQSNVKVNVSRLLALVEMQT